MALIAMCTYDPPGESRHELLYHTLRSLDATVDLNKHRLFIVANGPPSPETDRILLGFPYGSRIMLEKNLGTARGINKAWEFKRPGEHCVKMDSDIVLQNPGWLESMEECFQHDPTLGIVGLKRRDCLESPHVDPGSWAHSELKMLPHVPGQRWYTVEVVGHVMGTCQMYNSSLLDKIGYLVQYNQYGFDDALAAVRCKAAGFYSAFLCNHDVDHPDPGGTPYSLWKTNVSGDVATRHFEIAAEILEGKRTYYAGPNEYWS